MPTIIDSLFLELGIDTSKFSADQSRALAKIQQFESQTKRAASGARKGVQTVGDAFRDLANDSNVGATAKHLDTLSGKLRAFGQAARVSGGGGTPFGLVADGLGAMLSPAALGVAAIGALGAGMWDLNKVMTASNATMYRQAQLAGVGAANLWAWGEAAKTVGANPLDVAGGIAGLQTSILGMGIGAANATPQLIALARLGVPFNFQSGVSQQALFARVHALAAARDFKNLGGLRALTGPVMNDAMFALATDRYVNPGQLHEKIEQLGGAQLGRTLERSLQSQAGLGRLGISKDVLSETMYGGEQGLMLGVILLLRKLVNLTETIADDIGKVAIWFVKVPGKIKSATSGVATDVEGLIPRGIRNKNPGNLKYAGQPGAIGKDAQGFAIFGSMADGVSAMRRQLALDYRRGETSISSIVSSWAPKAENDTAKYIRSISRMMGVGADAFLNPLMLGPLAAAMMVQENGAKAMLAAAGGRGLVQHTVTHHTRIGAVNVTTQATDANGMALEARKALNTHPLLGPLAQQTITLATRGAQ